MQTILVCWVHCFDYAVHGPLADIIEARPDDGRPGEQGELSAEAEGQRQIFACGALALAQSQWPSTSGPGPAMMLVPPSHLPSSPMCRGGVA